MTACDGFEAIECFLNSRDKIDLILMDCLMPNTDGYDATKEITKLERRTNDPPITIIALTASVLQDARDKCCQASMNDFVSKPFEEENLLAVIQKSLQQAKTSDNGDKHDSNSQLKSPIQSYRIDENNQNLEILNTEKLDSMFSRFGESKGQQVIAIFIATITNNLQKLDEAAIAEESEAIHRAAHNLKSSCGMIGAETAQNLAKQVEYKHCESEGIIDSDLISLLIHEAQQATERVKSYTPGS